MQEERRQRAVMDELQSQGGAGRRDGVSGRGNEVNVGRSGQTDLNHPWVGGPPYVNGETGETRVTPPDGWLDTTQMNPNHPWTGGPPYVNCLTGESRDTAPDRSKWQMNPNHPWVGGPPYVNKETGESREMPPDGWRDMAQTNPNHPWVGGPPYVNTETGERRETLPDGWVDISKMNPNHPWTGGPPYVNCETGEVREEAPDGWQRRLLPVWVHNGTGWVDIDSDTSAGASSSSGRNGRDDGSSGSGPAEGYLTRESRYGRNDVMPRGLSEGLSSGGENDLGGGGFGLQTADETLIRRRVASTLALAKSEADSSYGNGQPGEHTTQAGRGPRQPCFSQPVPNTDP